MAFFFGGGSGGGVFARLKSSFKYHFDNRLIVNYHEDHYTPRGHWVVKIADS